LSNARSVRVLARSKAAKNHIAIDQLAHSPRCEFAFAISSVGGNNRRGDIIP
jgi:hypothetical protein